MGRKRSNNVYRHFMLQEETQTATCLFCYRTLKTTHGTNLMYHLKHMHTPEFHKVVALNRGKIPLTATNSPPRDSRNSKDEDSNQSDAAMELELDLDKYFTQDGSVRARCDICRASVEVKGNGLLNHLKREHSEAVKAVNNDSDAEDQDDLYQEVVYLYDSDSKTPKTTKSNKPVKRPAPPAAAPSAQKQKTKQSQKQLNMTISDFEKKKRRRTQDNSMFMLPLSQRYSEELENFGKYVTCLMKTVPEDLCNQLQMEIINVIMTAKIKYKSVSDANSSLAEKLEGPSVGYQPPKTSSVDVNLLDDNSVPSPESHPGDALKNENY